MNGNLPEVFLKRIETILGDEFLAYQSCLTKKAAQGIRVNELKLSSHNFASISPFSLTKIPWSHNGFYISPEEKPAKHAFYYAGLYYIQEPSAMLPAEALPVVPGDKVLDLCAAPGGKTTELGAKLQGKGVLISNDISYSRAKALLKNVELAGIKNAVVLSESPQRLAERFPSYFDKILVDAPCSGEGMFRKDPDMAKNWEESKLKEYGSIQRNLLSWAVKMLKPGGSLVYSTCTFSPEENEESVLSLLEQEPSMELLPVEMDSWLPGFSKGVETWRGDKKQLEKCVRLWPFKVQGEGHFLALFGKKDNLLGSQNWDLEKNQEEKERKPISWEKETLEFFRDFIKLNENSPFMEQGGKIYQLPEGLPDLKGLRILRSGLFLGEQKKKRFEPSQALAMSLRKEEYPFCLDLEKEDPNVIRYLKGETISLKTSDMGKKGWRLVCVEGYPLGWGKVDGKSLKNKYYPGWRWM